MHRLNSLQSSTALHTRIAGVRHLRHLGLTYLNDVISTFVFDSLDVGHFSEQLIWLLEIMKLMRLELILYNSHCCNRIVDMFRHEQSVAVSIGAGISQPAIIVPLCRIGRPHRKAGGWQNSINYGSFRVPRPSRNTLLLCCVEKSLKKYRRRMDCSIFLLQTLE